MKSKLLLFVSAAVLFSLTFLVPSYNSVKNYLSDEFDAYTCDVFPNPTVSVKIDNFQRDNVKVKLRLYYTRNAVPTFVKNKTIYNLQDYNPRCGFLNPYFNDVEVIKDLSKKNTSKSNQLPSIEDILWGPQHTFYIDNYGNKVDCSKKVCFYSHVYQNDIGFSPVYKFNYKKLFTLITFLIFLFSLTLYIKNRYN
jgi:hypothetical protein